MPLTPEEITELIAQLDKVCREAQELRDKLEAAMSARAHAAQPDRRGQPERRRAARKK